MAGLKETLRKIGISRKTKPVEPEEPPLLPLSPGPCNVFTRNLRPYPAIRGLNPVHLPTHVVVEQDGVEKIIFEPFKDSLAKRIRCFGVFNDGHTFAVAGGINQLVVFHKDRFYKDISSVHGEILARRGFKISPDGNYLLFAAVQGMRSDVYLLRLEDMGTNPISYYENVGHALWWPIEWDFSEDGKKVEIVFQTALTHSSLGPESTTKKSIPIKEEDFNRKRDPLAPFLDSTRDRVHDGVDIPIPYIPTDLYRVD